MAEQKIGVVTHYFGKIGVAALKITDGELKVCDKIHVTDSKSTRDRGPRVLEWLRCARRLRLPGRR